jgi:hypothetical protein
MLTVSHLKAEHFWLGWLPVFRVMLLSAGCLGALWLSAQLIRRAHAAGARQLLAGTAMLLPVGLMAMVWSLVFFVW